MKKNLSVFFAGIAGSGKSMLTSVFSDWLTANGVDVLTVNLDPGATNIEYSPDVNIRDWVSLEDVMDEHGLGPNGAQIVSADMLSLHMNDVMEVVRSFESDYIIWDTPGQIELFVFREASKFLLGNFDTHKTVLGFLFEPSITKTPEGYVSQIMLAASTRFRLNIPMLHILSKVDLLDEEQKTKIWNWKESQELYASLRDGGSDLNSQLSFEFFKVMDNMGIFHPLLQVSSYEQTGLDLLFAQIQQMFMGGEVPDDSFYSEEV